MVIYMIKTKEELQAELDREREYTRKVNDRYERMREQLMELQRELQRQRDNSIPKSEHGKIVEGYELRLSEIKSQLSRPYNERGAGRKKIATKEIAEKVLELSKQGLSQAKIAAKLSGELNIRIGRTTVGEIVRGNYAPPGGK